MSTTDKIYNYEVMPPAGVWESIVSELDSNPQIAPVIPMQKKSNKLFYYGVAAAACAIVIIFLAILSNKHSVKNMGEGFLSSSPQNNSALNNNTPVKNNDPIITVPTQDSNYNRVMKNKSDEKFLAQNTQLHGGPLEKKIKEDNDNTKSDMPDNVKDTIANDIRPTVKPGEFLTIAGSEGQSIKVSSKAALLIDSSDNKIPPKLIWNKKIAQWREIMKGNTLAPTPGNFLDIIELSKTLKDK